MHGLPDFMSSRAILTPVRIPLAPRACCKFRRRVFAAARAHLLTFGVSFHPLFPEPSSKKIVVIQRPSQCDFFVHVSFTEIALRLCFRFYEPS